MPHFGLEVTPLAADGVLYVTGPNQVVALDAETGRALWTYSRPPTPGLVGDSQLGTNRGVALRGDTVYFVTDNAHLLALDRGTGALRWETPMAPDAPPSEPPHHYGGTVAPLVVRDMVVAGVAGADAGIRGFVAAFNAESGALVWRRWTVPRRGERGIETWQGPEPIRGGGSTWLTGSYDASSDTLYWATGNPWPGGDDRDRPGDNLYTNCVLALDATTGELKWHYQFTPHDVADRDATEPNVLVDRVYRGKPSKLLLHADRNGFFYVLDRTNGAVLLAKPFLRRVDWASAVGADGRPVVKDPRGCPVDAANWSSTAYSPETGLYYFLALEECVGKPTGYPDQTGQRFLRAVEHRDRRDRVGSAAAGAGAGQDVERRPRNGDRVAVLRPAERRLHGRRSTRRPDAVAVSDQRAHEGLADDVRPRRPAIRRGCGWSQYPLFRFVRSRRSREDGPTMASGRRGGPNISSTRSGRP